jgi:hypothetical protein
VVGELEDGDGEVGLSDVGAWDFDDSEGGVLDPDDSDEEDEEEDEEEDDDEDEDEVDEEDDADGLLDSGHGVGEEPGVPVVPGLAQPGWPGGFQG